MKKTKEIFKKSITTILNSQGTDEVLSEAALPAYAHKNPVIDYIFWQRLSESKKFIIQNCNKNASILDFGCGTGVFSYELGTLDYQVTALDLDLSPIKLLESKINYPKNINFIEGDFLKMDFNNQKFDAIVALDVLEHIPIEMLPTFLDKFKEILKPNGYFVVSGPTENFLYKLGRKIAGNDFTGHYHETTISEIKKVFRNYFEVKTIKKLIWPLTLFEVFYAKN